MEQYVIEGQTKLRGMLPVHGPKKRSAAYFSRHAAGASGCVKYIIARRCPMWRRPLPFCSLWAAGCSRAGGSDRRRYDDERCTVFPKK